MDRDQRADRLAAYAFQLVLSGEVGQPAIAELQRQSGDDAAVTEEAARRVHRIAIGDDRSRRRASELLSTVAARIRGEDPGRGQPTAS